MLSTRASGNAANDLITLIRLISDDGGKALLAQMAEERTELEKLSADIEARETALKSGEKEHAAIAAENVQRERDLTGIEQAHAEKIKALDVALAGAAVVQKRVEEFDGREAAIQARSDALDKREADIAKAAAQRSAELDDRAKGLDDREAKLVARTVAVRKAMEIA